MDKLFRNQDLTYALEGKQNKKNPKQMENSIRPPRASSFLTGSRQNNMSL